MKIAKVHAHEIIASGGYPTVEATVTLESGQFGSASVPYGASAGSHEAHIIEDKDASRYLGHGMLQAVANVNGEIATRLVGEDISDQARLDQILVALDGTPDKSRLGGNAILAVSLAAARAGAAFAHEPLYRYLIRTYNTQADLTHLPRPMVVAIEGGKHADHTTDLQEFCLTATGQKTVAENLRAVLETYHTLQKLLQEAHLSTNVGNEGAFAPSGLPTNETPLLYLLTAITRAGYLPKTDLGISIDAAASEFYRGDTYNLSLDHLTLTGEQLISYYEPWFVKYPIVTIEDMLHEDDWGNWAKLKIVADRYHIPLIGDDLTVTNPDRLKQAIAQSAISGILIKPNQIGTITETMQCCRLAKEHAILTVTSHRGGGETNDTAIVDLAVAVGSSYLKVGPTRGERVVKYNRLLAIERELTNE